MSDGLVNSIFTEMQDEIKSTVLRNCASIKPKVVEYLAQKIEQERVALVIAAITKIEETKKEIKKIKPNQKQFDANGVEQLFFTPDVFNKKKNLEETVSKLDNALKEALNSSNYDPLTNLMKSDQGKPEQNKPSQGQTQGQSQGQKKEDQS